ncbi:hypothetical protein DRO61_04925 [Candidatus Bathyarchaeota archaeon]|nr:MAG: hypothetical protein DRO61_04925 [Candidatus Bathyarchaeota archaeon]
MDKIPKEYKWAGSIILIIVTMLIANYFSPENITRREIESLLVREMKNKSVGRFDLAEKDGWKNNYKFYMAEDKTRKLYVVTSSGADKEFFTKDDITAERTDYNKSRIVGKFIADKLSEATGGVKDSLSERLNKPKDPEHEGLSRKIGKKIGQTFKNFKEGMKDGAKEE